MTTIATFTLDAPEAVVVSDPQFTEAFERFRFRLSSVTEEDFVAEAQAVASLVFPKWRTDKQGDIGWFVVRLYIKAILQGVYLANAWAQEFNLFTARELSSVISHARRLGFNPASNSPARVDVIMTMPEPLVARNFSASEIVMNTQNADGEEDAVFFENEFAFSVGAGISQVQVQMIAGRTFTQTYTADATDFQTVILEQAEVLDDSVAIEFSALPWTEVESLVNSNPTDRHFTTRLRSDLLTEIQFGDGSTGARPPDGVTGNFTYRVGGGDISNVPEENLDFVFSAPAPVPTAINPLGAKGGLDADGIEEIRVKAPQQVRTRDSLVTLTDIENFSESFAGVARAVAQLFGTIVQVGIIPNGGGVATTALKAELQTAINTRIVMGYASQVGDPVFIAPTIQVEFTTREGFVSAEVEQAVATDLAALLSPLTTRFDEVLNRTVFTREFGEDLFLNDITEVLAARPEIERDFRILLPTNDIAVDTTEITSEIGASISASSRNVRTVGFVSP